MHACKFVRMFLSISESLIRRNDFPDQISRTTIVAGYYISSHARAHAHTPIHTHPHMRGHSRTYALSHAHTHARTHARTHAHTHTHTRTHSPAESVICAPDCLYISSLKTESTPAPDSTFTLNPASTNFFTLLYVCRRVCARVCECLCAGRAGVRKCVCGRVRAFMCYDTHSGDWATRRSRG